MFLSRMVFVCVACVCVVHARFVAFWWCGFGPPHDMSRVSGCGLSVFQPLRSWLFMAARLVGQCVGANVSQAFQTLCLFLMALV